ncbi:hypothetical protein [Okeania sp. SIO1I7]|nr:hypothetical protein [Okeania sp. SIO1I7]NET29566.1 hypothetical protein [Okeania sp. SIO1I7]
MILVFEVRKKEEGRRKKEEGRRQKAEGLELNLKTFWYYCFYPSSYP